jgi:hypothetical protein
LAGAQDSSLASLEEVRGGRGGGWPDNGWRCERGRRDDQPVEGHVAAREKVVCSGSWVRVAQPITGWREYVLASRADI